MPDITSDTYAPIIADGDYDVKNLALGKTYGVKFHGTFEVTTLSLLFIMPNGDAVPVDDSDAAGIDGTGVTEFTLIMPGRTLRITAANTVAVPDIDYTVFPIV